MSAVAWLIDRIRQFADRDAIISRDQATTFGHLAEDVERRAVRLRKDGIGRGSIVALEGDYSPHVCATFLAIGLGHAVVVPLTSATAAERNQFRQVAEVSTVVVESDVSRRLEAEPRPPTNPLLREFVSLGQPGVILFSSGSAGVPKAILHDLGALLEKFKHPRPALRTLAFLLLDHIGGLNTLFHTLANGGSIVVAGARDPASVCAAIERHRVELLPTSPSFLNLLLMSGEHERYDLGSLKVITYGTEVMPQSVLARLQAAVPNVELRQTYGLSEVGILRAKSLASDSTWVRLGGEGYETKIVDGTLRIRARSSMVGYLNYPSPFDAEGWFDTGDLVESSGEYVKFIGRRTALINVGGQKVHPTEVEDLLLDMPEIGEVIVYGEANPIMGQVVAAKVRPTVKLPAAELRARMRAHCAGRLAPFKVPTRIVQVDAPLHNARFKKISTVHDPAAVTRGEGGEAPDASA